MTAVTHVAVLRPILRAGAEGLRDVGRRVADRAVDLAAETVVEHVLDRVELDAVCSVCDEVTRTPMLTGVERCDLSVEAVGLPFEVGEVVLRGRQLEVGLASLSAWPLPALQRSDVCPLILELLLGLGSGFRERGEVARSIWRRSIEDRLGCADVRRSGRRCSRSPAGPRRCPRERVACCGVVRSRRRGCRARRRCPTVAGVWAVFEPEVELGMRSSGTCRRGSPCGRATSPRRRALGRGGRRRASSSRHMSCRGPCSRSSRRRGRRGRHRRTAPGA